MIFHRPLHDFFQLSKALYKGPWLYLPLSEFFLAIAYTKINLFLFCNEQSLKKMFSYNCSQKTKTMTQFSSFSLSKQTHFLLHRKGSFLIHNRNCNLTWEMTFWLLNLQKSNISGINIMPSDYFFLSLIDLCKNVKIRKKQLKS